jgi:hypothetical protein
LAIINDTLGLKDLLFVSYRIVAAYADTTLITGFSFSEALAVEFETIDFGAFASLLVVLSWGQI